MLLDCVKVYMSILLTDIDLLLQANKLVIVKEQYIILVHLNMSVKVPAVKSSCVQLIDTKFTISGLLLHVLLL